MVSRIARDGQPGPQSSIVRFYYSQLSQRVFATSLLVLGQRQVYGSADAAFWTGGYLNSFRHVIAGGTKDIQRNIIGERVLGLPKNR
jgi:alkylation response protein AidB-like acyl-CoA dehydrogenase